MGLAHGAEHPHALLVDGPVAHQPAVRLQNAEPASLLCLSYDSCFCGLGPTDSLMPGVLPKASEAYSGA